MIELSEEQKEIRWQTAVVDSGLFESIRHPEYGYELGKAVAGKDGLVYGFVGVKPDGQLMLSKDKKTQSVDLVTDKNFVRKGEALMIPLIYLGLVPKPGKNVQFIDETEWTKGIHN